MRLEAQDSGIWALRSITQEFTALMRDRDLNALSDWMDKASATGIPAMMFFVKGLRRDQAAVNAAFFLPWSNGRVAGHVHRLTLIKRQMYRRAGFTLLHRRVLPCANHEERCSP
jgi:transposase